MYPSKRCSSITYCSTLLRPSFCPFCLGDHQLPAASRWRRWTREAKLWSHLESHLAVSCWPSTCPHPLCSLELSDELSFLYHLNDVHSLRMSAHMTKCRLPGRTLEPLIKWTTDITSQKRKRQDGDGQELRPSKRTTGPLKINWRNEQSPDQSLDQETPDRTRSASSPGSSKASFTGEVADVDPKDLPELTYSESMSPPNTEELHSIEDLCASEDVRQKELHDEVEWLRDLSEAKFDEDESQLPGEDSLFSQYLRSRSPSCFSAKGIGSTDNDGGIHSQTVTPGDICLSTEEDFHPADLMDQNTAKPKTIPVNTSTTRIILRIRQPKPPPKPKVLLRLSQPKRAPARRSVPQGMKNRRRRRT